MNELTPRQLRGLFWAIELNLLFWLGVSFDPSRMPGGLPVLPTAIPGLILAIGLQHWAYYNLFKASRDHGEGTAIKFTWKMMRAFHWVFLALAAVSLVGMKWAGRGPGLV